MELFNRYFLDTVKNRYAQFTGRASRSEFWYFALFYFLLDVAVLIIDTYLLNPVLGVVPQQAGQGGVLQMLFALALLVPSIALGIRRLHDIGKSGWWYLLVFIPVIGWLLLLYFYVTDSQPGTNRFGENPKER